MDSSRQHRSGSQWTWARLQYIIRTRFPLSTHKEIQSAMQWGSQHTKHSQPSGGKQATIDVSFKRGKNYWKSYMNIRRAVFNCLDDGIDDAFKVSNDPTLTGWNASMEPRDMFDQITATYGRPTPAALLQNDTLFRSVYSPQDAPEVLFRRIEDCREVQILGEDPYTAQQLLNNAVCLLLQTGLYP